VDNRNDGLAWARLGHRLGRTAAAMLDDPTSFRVFDFPRSSHYVQWHGEHGREFYAEASSGAYGVGAISAEQDAQLAALGWDPPWQGWGGDDVLNYSRHWTAPVPVYEVVRLTLITLRDVYGARAADISI